MVLPSPGMPDDAALARDRRVGRVVHEAHVVVVERAEVDVLAGVERFHGRDEAEVERVRIRQLLLERVLPPLERLARDGPGPELGSQLLVEDHAAAVVRHAEPGRRELLEARARHPEDRILADAVLLGLAALLEQLGVALERLALEPGLAEQLVVVDEDPHRGEVRQPPRLAVALGDGLRERREVLDVLIHPGQPVDGRGDALVDVAREVLHGRLRDIDGVAGRVHGGELRHLGLDVGLDDLVDLDRPVLLELLGDLLVDLAVLPDDEGDVSAGCPPDAPPMARPARRAGSASSTTPPRRRTCEGTAGDRGGRTRTCDLAMASSRGASLPSDVWRSRCSNATA